MDLNFRTLCDGCPSVVVNYLLLRHRETSKKDQEISINLQFPDISSNEFSFETLRSISQNISFEKW